MVMRQMKESHVAQLCPVVGDQVTFLSNRDEWVKSLNQFNQATASTSLYNMDSQNMVNLLDGNFSNNEQQRLNTPPLQNENLEYSQLVNNAVNSVFTTPPVNNNTFAISPGSSNPTVSLVSDTSISIGPAFVRSVLNSSTDGKRILRRYNQNNCLDADDRKELVHILIYAILRNEPSRSIHTHEFSQLALQIEEVFPREAQAVYFVPYLRATEHLPKRNASGLLYQRYIGYRRSVRNKELIPVQRRKSSRSSTPRTSRPASPLPLSQSLLTDGEFL